MDQKGIPRWEKAPIGSKCGRTAISGQWVKGAVFYKYNPEEGDGSCFKDATWRRESTCFCGKHNMSFNLCDEHKKEYEDKQKE